MIPIFSPSYGEEEIEAVTKVLESKWWGQGPKVEEFEAEFAKFVGVKHAIAVNSGTAALHLALKVINIDKIKKAKVAMPSLTFISDALAAKYNRMKPRFQDINPLDLCVDYSKDNRQFDEIDYFIQVHYAGNLAPKTFSYHSIIEDCAHACGTVGAGLQSSLACWSFHAVKNLATGDGGMITTDVTAYAERLRALRWCGINRSTWERTEKKYGWDYSIEEIGYKCHMNDLTAALGLVQLQHIKELNDKRYSLAFRYNVGLCDQRSWLMIPTITRQASNHMYVIRVLTNQRNRFIDYMLEHGISVGVHYKPLNHYPMFKKQRDTTPETEKAWQTLVTLPLYPDLSFEDQGRIINIIKKFPI